ncbi:MAG: VOC family protein [Silvibacterium sp.]|nr:VOC family protein [Silvibacterium sp.]MBV8437331.1 VOC family protein [Silvibacterium sp.]
MAKAIPDGYHSVQPYLYFKNTAEAIAFYSKVFGATERMRMPDKNGRIMHAEINIGDCCIMMADENPAVGAYSTEHFGGAPMSLMLYVEDCETVYKQALNAGAKSLREPADQFYGDRMAGVADPFGFHWWIGTHIKDVSMEEMMQHA